jgi:ATP-binding cassette subfamily B protein
VDGTDLARIEPAEWRSRLSGAFQDFARLEFIARHSVGLGDLPRLDDSDAVRGALRRASASDVVEGLAGGLDTQLGAGWPDGSSCPSASGRSWRWRAAACARARC